MRDLGSVKRVVVKIGTQQLRSPRGINREYILRLSQEMSNLMDRGIEVLLVSSGAVGLGAQVLNLGSEQLSIQRKQACASIGQPLLMQYYRQAFLQHQKHISQVLVTRDTFNRRDAFVNLQNTINTLLQFRIIPIFNENDAISTAEIGPVFGDNDTLSAMIASKSEADLLILCTDVDGLYTANPQTDSSATLISEVHELTKEIEQLAGGAGTSFSTGGMKTKIQAVSIAAEAGCNTIIASGKSSLEDIVRGEQVGTLFHGESRIASRSRWMIHSDSQGELVVDDGALEAIREGKSLLASGVVDVFGVFRVGDVVTINGQAKAMVSMNSTEVSELMGKHSTIVKERLGDDRKVVVAQAENIVFYKKRESEVQVELV